MATVIAFGNLDKARTRAQQAADVREMRANGATVIAAVECIINVKTRLGGYENNPIGCDQTVWTADPQVAAGSIRCAFNTFGNVIGPRRFVWSVPTLAGLPKTAVVAVHMPPKRMWGPLYVAYVTRLAMLVARLRLRGYQVICVGDWNKLVTRDPAGLRARFGGRLFGVRIDGGYATRRIARHITNYREVARPNRTDNHTFGYITLG